MRIRTVIVFLRDSWLGYFSLSISFIWFRMYSSFGPPWRGDKDHKLAIASSHFKSIYLSKPTIFSIYSPFFSLTLTNGTITPPDIFPHDLELFHYEYKMQGTSNPRTVESACIRTQLFTNYFRVKLLKNNVYVAVEKQDNHG